MGCSSLDSPKGSLFLISPDAFGNQPLLRPISLETLAFPAGLALSPNEKFIYVAEMLQNRVLRYFESPDGVYKASVFFQFSGGVGPVALDVDSSGNLYVAHFDVKESSADGRVSIISAAGKLMEILVTPGAEISGICVRCLTLFIPYRFDCLLMHLL